MKYINEKYTNTLEIKQSKFIAHLVAFNEYEDTLEQLKIKHPKARHFVTAYRYLNKYNQILEHSSDDGEPKGTSGKPSLMVLQGQNLINCAVIIVRYFGGTKLGTGGLVRAYSDAVNLVIDLAQLHEYKEEVSKKIVLEYANIRQIEYECEKYNIKIIDKIFSNNIVYELKASKTDMYQFLEVNNRIFSDF